MRRRIVRHVQQGIMELWLKPAAVQAVQRAQTRRRRARPAALRALPGGTQPRAVRRNAEHVKRAEYRRREHLHALALRLGGRVRFQVPFLHRLQCVQAVR